MRRAHRLLCPAGRPQGASAHKGAATADASRATGCGGSCVLRKVDSTGYPSFAGTAYFVGARLRGQQVEVRLLGHTLQISQRGNLLRTWLLGAIPGRYSND